MSEGNSEKVQEEEVELVWACDAKRRALRRQEQAFSQKWQFFQKSSYQYFFYSYIQNDSYTFFAVFSADTYKKRIPIL